ncbi:MAG: ComF family protein, partial [Bacteroidales bacterium]|nr:ComF family protein [Bacteroidales bacterium]
MKGRFIHLLRCSLAGLRDLFFERTCTVCGAPLEADERFLCSRCLEDIPLTYFWSYCENAALDLLAGKCHVYNAAALFFYRHESPYCEIVRQFKYGRQESLGLWAARRLGGYLASGGLYGGVQAVVPVPLHWYKRFKRGFNQAELIARGVAEGILGASGGGLGLAEGMPGERCGDTVAGVGPAVPGSAASAVPGSG